MTRFMLDTNTVSYLVRGHATAIGNLIRVSTSSCCVSSLTEGELRFGLARRSAATKLSAAIEELLLRLDILPWTSATAKLYGGLRARQERNAKPLAPVDLLIAAHALEADAVLVTSDQAFRQVAGLRVEDWTK